MSRISAFSILPNKLNDGSLCYVIDNNDLSISNWWSLVLADPMTVLQCMRMNFNGSLKNMAHYLFYSSIKFNTCILHDPPENDDLPYQPLSLGWCPSEYESKPTTGDYGKYQANWASLRRMSFVLVAKAKYFLKIWPLAWVLVPTVQRMVSGSFVPDSGAYSSTKEIHEVAKCFKILQSKDQVCGSH